VTDEDPNEPAPSLPADVLTEDDRPAGQCAIDSRLVIHLSQVLDGVVDPKARIAQPTWGATRLDSHAAPAVGARYLFGTRTHGNWMQSLGVGRAACPVRRRHPDLSGQVISQAA
jgi:hypothetical protein